MDVLGSSSRCTATRHRWTRGCSRLDVVHVVGGAEEDVAAKRIAERRLEAAAVQPHRKRIGERRYAVLRIAQQPRLAEIGADNVRGRHAVARVGDAARRRVQRVVIQTVTGLHDGPFTQLVGRPETGLPHRLPFPRRASRRSARKRRLRARETRSPAPAESDSSRTRPAPAA